jgi:hypothetical protein
MRFSVAIIISSTAKIYRYTRREYVAILTQHCDAGHNSKEAPCTMVRLASAMQENTNSIFCSRPLAGLRQQVEVWFYRE